MAVVAAADSESTDASITPNDDDADANDLKLKAVEFLVAASSGHFSKRSATQVVFDHKNTYPTAIIQAYNANHMPPNDNDAIMFRRNQDLHFIGLISSLATNYSLAPLDVKAIAIDALARSSPGLVDFAQRQMIRHGYIEWSQVNFVTKRLLKYVIDHNPNDQSYIIRYIFTNICNRFDLWNQFDDIIDSLEPSYCDCSWPLWEVLERAWTAFTQYPKERVVLWCCDVVKKLLRFANDDGSGIYVESIPNDSCYLQMKFNNTNSDASENILSVLFKSLYSHDKKGRLNGAFRQSVVALQAQLQAAIERREKYKLLASITIHNSLCDFMCTDVINIVSFYVPRYE
jgi:hypothetical protein